MSKSDPDLRSRIDLLDPPDLIREKFKKAVSDFTSTISYDPEKRPGVSNLIDIHAAFLDLFPEDIVEEDPEMMLLDTLGYKKHVAEVVVGELAPIQEEYRRLQEDPGHLDGVLAEGSRRAKEIAAETLTMAKRQMGLL
jgi:tryptophanyl-tRNA synthetase